MTPVLDVAAATDAGRVRMVNEDCIAADAAAGYAVLADGMGGHKAGEVASRMALELMLAGLKAAAAPDGRIDPTRAEDVIASGLAAANTGVFEAARVERRYDGMGTTLVAVVWHTAGMSWGHVGDSRLYRLRDGRLSQLTRDHSIVQEQLERGAISQQQARRSPNRNVLTRAVGIDRYVEADVRSSSVQPGDLYLLCSDGLTDMVSDEEIEQRLVDCGDDIRSAVRRLIDNANERGGIDNISVVLARVIRVSPERAL